MIFFIRQAFEAIGQRLSYPKFYDAVYMISSSSQFTWASLEQVPGLCAMPASWKRRLGPAFDVFRNRFLRVNPAIANLPELPTEHVPLELNWREFGGRLADALECRRKLSYSGFSQAYQIGSWGEKAVPVFLTINSDERDFVQAATGLAAFLRQRFILFAPTNHHLTALVLGILKGHDAAFFTLQASLRLTDAGKFQALQVPGQMFASFNPPNDGDGERNAKMVVAALSRLDPQTQGRKAPASMVLRLYCVEGLEPDQIANRCRCARSLVYSRLSLLRKTLGCDPAELRPHSAHLERLTEGLADSRARRVRAEAAIYDEVEDV